jgi:CDP-glucose 4,6-dehydratase
MSKMFEVYNESKVLVTGHTGFKGSWLVTWLTSLGAVVAGLSDKIPSKPSNYKASGVDSINFDYKIDIRNYKDVEKAVKEFQPDFVFHLAAQALVRDSYNNPLETLETNALGSANILESLRVLDKKVVIVMVTSDKSYDNVEWAWGYRETDQLGGKDPYSASKGMAELAIKSYVKSFFNNPDSQVRIGVARAGNVIGGGDWAKDRIIPDCIRSWSEGSVVDIRSPNSTRPWQHVLEPLSGYLALAVNLSLSTNNHGEAYNFGPSSTQNNSVRELIDEMAKYWDKIKWRDVSKHDKYLHEAGLLKLNCDKALFDLEWKSTLQFEETIKMTVEWYKEYYEDQTASMSNFTLCQINKYIELAKYRKVPWACDD